jgi:hypothetical protein
MKISYAFLLAAALVGAAQPATAQIAKTTWSSIASACTPDSVSVQNNRYKSSPEHFVSPQAQKVDPVVLICPLSAPLQIEPNSLVMTYLDPVGAGTSVKAQFISVNRANGTRGVIATTDSNNFSVLPTVIRRGSFFNAGPLDFNTNFYYVRIEMDRTKTNQNIRVIGVALESIPN